MKVMLGTSSNQRLKPVGECIYCFRKDVRLDEEHIIPLGLGGKLILPEASCETCGTITGRIEQLVLRRMFPVVRARVGMKSRHKKKTAHEQVFDVSGGTTRTELLPIGETPFVLMGILMPPPCILTGEEYGGAVVKDATYWTSVHEMKDTAPGEQMRAAEVRADYFARMLAKIAYSFAVATLGLSQFNPLITDFILGRTSSADWRYFVGGYADAPPPTPRDVPHFLSAYGREANGKKYVVIDVRLFSYMGAPQYTVVVGELEREPDQILMA